MQLSDGCHEHTQHKSEGKRVASMLDTLDGVFKAKRFRNSFS